MRKRSVALCVAALLGSAPAAYGGDGSGKLYTNTKYHFSFKYPESYSLTALSDGVEVFPKHGDDTGMSLVIHNLEDLAGTCSLFRKKDCSSPRGMAFYRAELNCDSDGPDGTSYCGDGDVTVNQLKIGGKQAMEFHMVLTLEDYESHTKIKREVSTVCYFIVLSTGAGGHMMEACGYEGGATPGIVRSLAFE